MTKPKTSPKKIDRALNQDGTFNIHAVSRRHGPLRDFYHWVLVLTWPKFFLIAVGTYIGMNLLFGSLYYLMGADALSGLTFPGEFGRFQESFFFSVQTFATIGYGKLTPSSLGANILVTFETITGILSVALTTGVLFARFSRPTARIVFSKVATISEIDGESSFIFRLANERSNQIVEAQVSVVMICTETTKEGVTYRNLYDLKLERSRSPVFAASWVVVHPIDKTSPLYGRSSRNELAAIQTEFFVSVSGIDDTFGQIINARFSYIPEEIEFNRSFEDMMIWDEAGRLNIHIDRISDLKNSDLKTV